MRGAHVAYELNREAVALEGQVLRLAMKSGVKRDKFIAEWRGRETDPKWFRSISQKANGSASAKIMATK